MTPDTTTCDACGTRYAFTNYKDRCPVCCSGQMCDDDSSVDYEQPDEEEQVLEFNFIHDGKGYR
jgi:hypothetical protein